MADSLALTRRTFLIAPIALAACKPAADVIQLSGPAMGTYFSIIAVDHSGSVKESDLQQAITTELAEINAQMSNWDDQSEVSRFNANRSTAPIPVSPQLAAVVDAAGNVHRASAGQFDVTLGPLIELWGFGAKTHPHHAPAEDRIAEALEAVGQANLVTSGPDSLQKARPDAEIFLSAIGKGHGVDRIADVLASFGLSDYMVEIGGDIFTAGQNPDGMAWQIGIETPDAHTHGVQQIVGVSNMGMATSGDYRNYFEEDGQRYSHILDATTGRPITHKTASATVLAPNAMLADAWATAMLTLGRDRGMDLAKELGLAVLFVDRGPTADIGFVSSASPRFADIYG